jgi:hypothetical protein
MTGFPQDTVATIGVTSEVQKGQRVAWTGMLLKQYGQS